MSVTEGIVYPIHVDLRRTLLTVPGLPGAVKWEGKAFTPTPGVAWIEEWLDPVTARTATLGQAGQIEETYVYNLDIFWPRTMAPSEGSLLADRIKTTFYPGRQVASSGPVPIRGSVTRVERRRNVEGDDWFQIPVRVNFFVRRPTSMGVV